MPDLKVVFKTAHVKPGRSKWKFPPYVSCRPMVGDLVQDSSGVVLYVSSVMHCFSELPGGAHPVPYLEVQLKSFLQPH